LRDCCTADLDFIRGDAVPAGIGSCRGRGKSRRPSLRRSGWAEARWRRNRKGLRRKLLRARLRWLWRYRPRCCRGQWSIRCYSDSPKIVGSVGHKGDEAGVAQYGNIRPIAASGQISERVISVSDRLWGLARPLSWSWRMAVTKSGRLYSSEKTTIGRSTNSSRRHARGCPDHFRPTDS